MSGKSVGTLIASLTTITRTQGYSILLSGKGLTTPPIPQVGSCPNTLLMHQEWFRHSIRLIQRSHPLTSLRGATVLYLLLYYCTLNDFYFFFSLNTFWALYIIFFTEYESNYKSCSPSSTTLAISLITASTSNSQMVPSCIVLCCQSMAAAI